VQLSCVFPESHSLPILNTPKPKLTMRLRDLIPLLLIAAGCNQTDRQPVAYVGATLIDGTDNHPIPNAVMVVDEGRISAVGSATDVEIPRGATEVDFAGRYVIPGLVNAHGHVGDTKGLQTGQYSESNVLEQLSLYARYGITTVVSLGDDREASIRIRDAQSVATLDRARLFVAGEVVTGETPEQAIAIVESDAGLGVDFIKFRVDDNLGTTSKMQPDVYRAILTRAADLGLPTAVHVYYLDDTKDLVRAGVDFVAHSVRDRPVDDELITLLREAGVCYCATLMREVSTFVYESEPAFFVDPFFLSEADANVIATLSDPAHQESVRQNRAAQQYKMGVERAKRNLAQLAAGGVRIAMGTDTGPPGRFQGYFEHLELELMAEAGMSNEAIIRSATGDAAACMGLNGIGTLEVGSWADFIVLEADPIADIKNTRSIGDVYVAGNRLQRVAGS
jgi:imidazolonepropionase-like amidohydrolase